MRINKYLSEAGICSRREADRLIREGRVTLDGAPAEPGMQAGPESRVLLDGVPVESKQRKVYLKFYKPPGDRVHRGPPGARESGGLSEVSGAGHLRGKTGQGFGRPAAADQRRGTHRQDHMRARNRHEKEYLVTVDREYPEGFLEKLRKGVYLEELGVRTRPCKARRTGERSFRIVLTQGLNRQIRRMCQSCGFRVRTLRRDRILNVTLGDLKPGEYRELTEQELGKLRSLAGGAEHE